MTRQRARQTNKNASPAIPDSRLTSDIPESLLESQNGDLQFTVVLRYMCARFSMTSIKMMCQSQLCFYTHHNPGSVLVWYQCHKNITAEREMHSVSGQTPARGSCPQSSLHAQLPARPADWKWHHQFIYNMRVTVTKKKTSTNPCPGPHPSCNLSTWSLHFHPRQCPPRWAWWRWCASVTCCCPAQLLLSSLHFPTAPHRSPCCPSLPRPPLTESRPPIDQVAAETDWRLVTSTPHPEMTTVPPLTDQADTETDQTSSLLCLIQDGQQFIHWPTRWKLTDQRPHHFYAWSR